MGEVVVEALGQAFGQNDQKRDAGGGVVLQILGQNLEPISQIRPFLYFFKLIQVTFQNLLQFFLIFLIINHYNVKLLKEFIKFILGRVGGE